MATFEIKCITKPNVNSAHEHITHVGSPYWTPRRITVEQCIANIRNGNNFFVRDRYGNSANVVIVPASNGRREHIRTVADGRYTDNLLALDQCSL